MRAAVSTWGMRLPCPPYAPPILQLALLLQRHTHTSPPSPCLLLPQDPSLCVEELVAQLVDVVPGLGELVDRKYSLVVSSQASAMSGAARTRLKRLPAAPGPYGGLLPTQVD